MTAGKRAALYARVSTRNGHQDPEVQLQALREVAARAGWLIVETYIDHGISGAKGRDKRPAFDRLLKDTTRRKFDLVAAWSVDRLGRSLQDLLAFLSDLKASGCDLYLHVQALDTTTPGGKALFQILGVFAEFERAIIQERVHATLANARAEGKKLGRPALDAITGSLLFENARVCTGRWCVRSPPGRYGRSRHGGACRGARIRGHGRRTRQGSDQQDEVRGPEPNIPAPNRRHCAVGCHRDRRAYFRRKDRCQRDDSGQSQMRYAA